MCPTSLLLKISCLLLLGSITYCNAQRVLNAAEQTSILGLHNTKRAAEGASNMQVMVWSKTLAATANLTASDTCATPGNSAGQNIFVFSGTKVDLSAAVNAWYKVKTSYDYATQACTDNCDTYLQIVTFDIDNIGCAIYNCTDADGLKNATLVCAYGPDTMTNTDVPYLKGAACSNCSNGVFYCTPGGLCDGNCKTTSANCVCKAACRNCGTQTTDCKCQCSPGWQGFDCSGPCNDTLSECGKSLTSAMCTDPSSPWVRDFCPALCGICAPSVCPPDYKYVAATGKCYQIAYKPLTRSAAQTKCSAAKANLAFIETTAEQTAISTLWDDLFPTHADIQMWIGLCRKNATHNEDSAFIWSSSCTQGTGPSTLVGTKPLATSSWLATPVQEPNNLGYDPAVKTSGEWCVEMTNTAGTVKWNDVPCASTRNFYICELDPTCK